MNTTRPASVADNVRAEMARRRVTQADLASALAMSRTAAHRRLTGETEFRLDELQAVAEHLSVSLEQLLAPASCSCRSDHLEVGGFDAGCPVHDRAEVPA